MLLAIWNWLFPIKTVEQVLGVNKIKSQLAKIVDHHQTQIDVKTEVINSLNAEMLAHSAEATLASTAHEMLSGLLTNLNKAP